MCLYIARQSQKAASAYFTSKQILSFGFAEQYYSGRRQKRKLLLIQGSGSRVSVKDHCIHGNTIISGAEIISVQWRSWDNDSGPPATIVDLKTAAPLPRLYPADTRCYPAVFRFRANVSDVGPESKHSRVSVPRFSTKRHAMSPNNAYFSLAPSDC